MSPKNKLQSLAAKTKFTRAVVCFLTAGDQVLLGLRKKVSNNLGQNIIAGIGGKLEADESDEQALLREVDEEIGVKLKNYKYAGRVQFIFPEKPVWSQDVAIFTCSKWQGEPSETAAMKPQWYSQEDLPVKQMWQDNGHWLPLVLAGKKVEGIFLFDKDSNVTEYFLNQRSN